MQVKEIPPRIQNVPILRAASSTFLEDNEATNKSWIALLSGELQHTEKLF